MREVLYKVTWEVSKPSNTIFYPDLYPNNHQIHIENLIASGNLRFRNVELISPNIQNVSYFFDSESKFHNFLNYINQNFNDDYDILNGIIKKIVFQQYVEVDTESL